VQSVFARFVAALRRAWLTRFPYIRPAPASAPGLPKSSTFLVGPIPGLTRQLLINIQQSSKAWEVGQLTCNLVIAETPESPPQALRWQDDWAARQEGRYRIGGVLYGKDKWWHLTDSQPSPLVISWTRGSFEDQEQVIREALEDLSGDVSRVLDGLGYSPASP
jgi:hypothetical protein